MENEFFCFLSQCICFIKGRVLSNTYCLKTLEISVVLCFSQHKAHSSKPFIVGLSWSTCVACLNERDFMGKGPLVYLFLSDIISKCHKSTDYDLCSLNTSEHIILR